MTRTWKMLAVACVIAIAAASIAVAAPGSGSSSSSKSSSSAKSKSKSTARSFRDRHGPGDPREDLSALAKQLGVTDAKLRSALEAVRSTIKPPSRPLTQPPTQAQMDQRCNDLTDALGKELGKSGDDVRAAIKQVAKDRLAAEVKAGRLTSAQADRIRQDIDSHSCMPIAGGPIGPGGHGGPGCGGRGGHGHGFGPDGPGDFHGPPPAVAPRSGGSSGSSDSGASAPTSVPQTQSI
jgi:hypothetical protein